jgi:predicted acylesterase/phospholipase RssA
MSRPLRVLALDGGGIRGIITARVLAALEARCNKPVAGLFDLIVGTSTGGLLALALAAASEAPVEDPPLLAPTVIRTDAKPEHSAAELLDYYASDAESIFPEGPVAALESDRRLFGPGGLLRAWREPTRVLGRTAWYAAEAISPAKGGLRLRLAPEDRRDGPKTRYYASGLNAALDRYVGERSLRAALTDVIVASWDVSRKEPVLFSSRSRTGFVTEARMHDVARATSAAPTYFPPLTLRLPGEDTDRILVDGGLYANNPTLIGYLEGSLLAAPEERPLVVVSVGTGHPTPATPLTSRQWKRRRWRGVIQAIFDATLTGSAALNDELLRRTLQQQRNFHYWRFQTDLGPCSSAMDNPRPENVACLRGIADDLVTESDGLFDEIASTLRE